MKKIFTFLAVATLVAGCSKTDEALPASTFTITGYSAADTRTEFGEPDANSIPFLWSVGDKVWAGLVQSEALTLGGPSATFRVQGSAPQNGTTVYYNMMATQATDMRTAVVPTLQDVSKSLGENGDFGYATVFDGEFTLQHATSYLWFDIKALPANATLRSIRLHAGDAIVAGSKQWQGSQFKSTTDNGRSIIDLAVNKSSVSDEVLAMVVLPTEIESATVTYELSVSGTTKYYEQTLGSKTLAMGKTYKIAVDLSAVELASYTIRTLTFEDNHALFAPYSFSSVLASGATHATYSINKWSDLMPEEDYADAMLYGYYDQMAWSINGTANYKWSDSNNTLLTHLLPEYTGYDLVTRRSYQNAGEALSRSHTTDYTTYGDFSYERYAYAPSASNFCVHHGYRDFMNEANTTISGFEFSDGKARVIDHMYVANTAYVYDELNTENYFGVNYAGATEDTWFKITAYGYDSESDTEPTTVDFYLLATGKQFVENWTKWDLTSLGAVVKVEFNMSGSSDMTGEFGLSIPGYFAYDDVVVRF